jgi:hypothetical protein
MLETKAILVVGFLNQFELFKVAAVYMLYTTIYSCDTTAFFFCCIPIPNPLIETRSNVIVEGQHLMYVIQEAFNN